MADILVRPVELRQAADQLKSSAQKIGSSLQIIDEQVHALKSDAFLGNRSNLLQSHYSTKRQKLLNAQNLIICFSDDLINAATIFENADKIGVSNSGSGTKGSRTVEESHKDFNTQWREWTVKERIDYISKVYDAITAEYGIQWVMLSIEDIPEPKWFVFETGDARGFYSYEEGKIAIDSDNLHSDKGVDLLTTFIHEVRHQIQRELVERFRESGDQFILPARFSQDQIETWERNFENYVAFEDNPEGYRKQPVEQDARDFSSSYVDEYLVNNL